MVNGMFLLLRRAYGGEQPSLLRFRFTDQFIIGFSVKPKIASGGMYSTRVREGGGVLTGEDVLELGGEAFAIVGDGGRLGGDQDRVGVRAGELFGSCCQFPRNVIDDHQPVVIPLFEIEKEQAFTPVSRLPGGLTSPRVSGMAAGNDFDSNRVFQGGLVIGVVA